MLFKSARIQTFACSLIFILLALVGVNYSAGADATDRATELSKLTKSVSGMALNSPSPRIFTTQDGFVRFAGAQSNSHFATPFAVSAASDPEEVAIAFVNQWRNLVVPDSANLEFQERRVRTVGLRSYVHLRQVYDGVPVFGSNILVQVKSGEGVECVLSDVMRRSDPFENGALSLQSTSEAIAAQESACQFLASENKGLDFKASAPTLMLYDPLVVGADDGPVRLVWQMEVGNTGASLSVKEMVLIDAHSGKVAFYYSLIHDAKNRQIFDKSLGDILARSEGQAATGDPDVDQAYDYLGDTYDFYSVEHGRDSINGAGMTMKAHVKLSIANAYWDGLAMHFGVGFAIDDICGHELTHGVTEYESNLIYSYESGAINESLSDMWGEWVDLTNGAGNDAPAHRWYMGEELGPVRYMKDPAQAPFNDPDRYFSPNWYSGTGDNGGVHTNSGVGNKLCYLLTDGDTFNNRTITGFGISKTADLFYECQVNLLGVSSDYADLYFACLQAAVNLGWNSADQDNVEQACQAVEIKPLPEGLSNFNATSGAGNPNVALTWTNPTQAGLVTCIIRRSEGAFPDGPTDGDLVYDGLSTSITDGPLITGTRYYYAAWAYYGGVDYSAAANKTVLAGVEQPDYFTERFELGDNDLDNQTLILMPDGSADHYAAFSEPASAFPTDPSSGTVLSLGDDSYTQVVLAGGAQIIFYGTSYSSFYVGSNGYITFTRGDSDPSETVSDHFDTPRISGLFDDLRPSGNVSWKQLPDRAVVTFDKVKEYGRSTSNSFQFEMFFDGTICVTWLRVDAVDGLAGISEGLRTPIDFIESDLDAYPLPIYDDLVVTPNTPFFSMGPEGGPFSATSKTYTLTNTGVSPLDWEAIKTVAWADLAPATGTLAVGASINIRVSLNANAANLALGLWTDTVTITNTNSEYSYLRNVQLTVVPPPDPASAPNPVDGATTQSINTNLIWQNGGGATSFDIYFGDTAPPAFIGNQTETTYNPKTLSYSTTYTWRIDAVNIAGVTPGDLWTFGTEPPPPPPPVPSNPEPTDGATGVPVDSLLSWNNLAAPWQTLLGSSETVVPSQQPSEMACHLSNALSNVAIFQDSSPWGSSRNQTILTANGISFTIHTQADIGVVDLSPYDKVIVSSVQTSAFYDALETHRAWFEAYVSVGGILDLHLASYTSKPVDGRIMPGGFVVTKLSTNNVTITDATHPMFTTPHAISDADLDNWNSSSHGYFSVVPARALELLSDAASGKPCAMELTFDAGRIFATIQPVEFLGASYNYLENTILHDVAGAAQVIYDVYFGEVGSPMALITSTTQRNCEPVPHPMDYETTYTWQVVATNVSGSTPGPTWSFVTEGAPAQAINPYPIDGSTTELIDTVLRWQNGGGATSFNVYFGDTIPPTFIGNQTEATYSPGTLNYSTTYTWRVDAVNPASVTLGDRWTFGTEPPPPPPTVPANPDPSDGATGVPVDALLHWNGATSSSLSVEMALNSIIARSGILQTPVTIAASGASESGGVAGDDRLVLTRSEEIASLLTAAELGVQTASTLNVVICGAESDSAKVEDVRQKLIGTGQFNSVAVIAVRVITPTLAEMQAFNACLVWADSSYADEVAFGEVMADYVDSGGGVVSAVFEVAGSGRNNMKGRWLSDGYPLIPFSGKLNGNATMGAIHNPGHPIMAGVESFDGGGSSYRPIVTIVNAGVEIVADWSDGKILVATRVEGSSRRVDLGMFPPSSDVTGGWVSTTDGDILMANALTWTANSAPSVIYDVYFGEAGSPMTLITTTTQRTCEPVPHPMDYETTYTWQVVATNGGGSTPGPVWSFFTEGAPAKVINLSPLDGATTLSINTDIKWKNGGGATNFDVYFGDSVPPAFIGNQTGTTYDPGPLNYATTYTWRIDAVNPAGTTTGDLWDFGTKPPPPPPVAPSNPSPPDGATDVSVDALLSWSGGLSLLGEKITPNSAYSVLVFDDNLRNGSAQKALDNLGIPYTTVGGDQAAFDTQMDAGEWDLVVYDMGGSSIQASSRARIKDYMANGGCVLFFWWDLDSDATMASAFEVEVVSSFSSPRTVFGETPLHSVWTTPNTVPLPLDDYIDEMNDNGDIMQPIGSGIILGSFTSGGGTTNNEAMILGNNGRTIVHGFSPDENGYLDSNASGKLDRVELYENEIMFLLEDSDSIIYDVYFGELGSPMALITTTTQTSCEPVPYPMDYETTYTWQVLATNGGGSTLGPVWSFTTQIYTSPEIVVAPTSINVTLARGESTTRTLNIANALGANEDLNFTITTRETSRTLLALAIAGVGEPSPDHDFTKLDENAEFAPNEMLVRFEPKTDSAQRVSILSALGDATIERQYAIVPGLCLVSLPEGVSVEQSLTSFNQAAGVLYAEPNYTVHATQTFSNDPMFNDLWGLHNTGQTGGTPDADIDLPEAWDMHTGSRDVVVAVIDTGVDYNHPDLINNMWTNPGEIAGNGIDDDGNGFIDDIHGYDFVNDDGDPMDDHYHGTHCAGTIGAEGDNGIGIVGVCKQVSIMAVKFLSAAGSGSTANAISCVEYTTLMGVPITNNSWGGGSFSQALKDTINAAGAAGSLFVAAAGNSGSNNDVSPHYPSSYTSDNVLAVMNSTHTDVKAGNSCYGLTSVDLGAPGSSILSCKPGGGYKYLSGTSMATPHVAGASALLLSVNPTLSVADLKQTLMDTVDPTLAGRCVSGGRMNLAAAMAEVQAPWIVMSSTVGSGIAPGSSVDLGVGLSALDLKPGIYQGKIEIASNDKVTPALAVPVTMTVIIDDFVIDPLTDFIPSGYVGGPFTPSSTSCTLSNTGASSLDWTASKTAGWFDVFPSSGTLSSGASTMPLSISLNSNVNSLAIGVYADAVTFTNVTSGISQTLDIALTVREIPPPPPVPANPGPTDGATDVLVDTLLSWNRATSPSLNVQSALNSIIARSGILDGPITLASNPKEASGAFLGAAGPEDSDPPVFTDPKQIAQVRTAAESGIVAESDLDVLVCGSETEIPWLVDVQTKLLATAQFNSVSVFNVIAATPTLAELQAFDGVLVSSNHNYLDVVKFGNAMADYVDSGGRVVSTMFECGVFNGSKRMMAGRWDTGEYYCILRDGHIQGPPTTLGTIYDSRHPILSGVSSFRGGASSYHTITFDITPDSTRIADWSDGRPLVVTKIIGGVPRADLALWPVSSDAREDLWDASTDGALLVANALSWVMGVTDQVIYDVYFGEAGAPMTLITSTTQTTCEPVPHPMDYETTYTWQVVATNPVGSTPGPVWSFVTGGAPAQAINPDPADGATSLSINTVVSWQDGGGATSFDVYFGDTVPPPFIGNQTETTYNPGTLYSANYSWRIDAVNPAGTTPGDLWSFATESLSLPFPANPDPADGATDVSVDALLSWNGATSPSLNVQSALNSIIARSGILDGPITLISNSKEASGAFLGAAGSEDSDPPVFTDPKQIAQVRTAAESGIVAESDLDVLVCGSETEIPWLVDVQTKLLATAQFNSVSVFNVIAATPTLAELQAFDGVLVSSNHNYLDVVRFGNVMADYVDSGGRVVSTMFECGVFNGSKRMMAGRWDTGEYYCILRDGHIQGPPATLGTIYDSRHPILSGVSSFRGGASSYHTITFDITPGSTRIADWSDGRPLVVTKIIGGVPRADLALWPVSSDAREDLWDASTDGALLMANALSWVIGATDQVTYDVYFGEAGAPMSLITTTSGTTCAPVPHPMEYETTYNWRVVARDWRGSTAGPVWNFTTEDQTPPVITLLGDNPTTTAVFADYNDAGAIAVDSFDGDITTSITVASDVNTSLTGTYNVTYNVSDSSGNPALTVTRVVHVVDDVAPLITLLGDDPTTIAVFADYVDSGATALDNYDGDITTSITAISDVNTSIPGAYSVTYNVSDSSGNSAIKVTRAVQVIDNAVPVITLLGDDPTTIAVFTDYSDAGATAVDNCDGNITINIAATSDVNTSIMGTYSVTYNVSDSSGNPALTVTRAVHVVDNVVPVITLLGDDPTTIAVFTDYIDAGVTAVDNYDGDITTSITAISDVNTAILGTYSVTYNVSDSSGNPALTVTRAVQVVDNVVPLIILLGDTPTTIALFADYVEAGAVAVDNYDGDLTTSITLTSDVNTSITGTYSVTYNVSDSSGNPALTVTRAVHVIDGNAPVITLLGDDPTTIALFADYVDAGATAADNYDGDLTTSITATSDVNTLVLGMYSVTYNVSDSSGNPALTVTRAVQVMEHTHTLTVLAGENGSIVTSPDQEVYTSGSVVSITALANEGYVFSHWTGDDVPLGQESENPLILTMDADKTITAVIKKTFTMAIETAGLGSGVVTKNSDLTVFTEGETVELTATEEIGSAFDGWTGDVPAGSEMTNPLLVAMDADKTITGQFKRLPAKALYKITTKKATLLVNDGYTTDVLALALSGGGDKSSIKIQRLKKEPKKRSTKAGVMYFEDLRLISELRITGAFGKITSDIEIETLTSDSSIKSITTKIANVAAINASSVGAIKMTALCDDQTKIAATTILTDVTAGDLKITLNGIVLENLVTAQNCKYIKLASKAWKDKATRAKYVSFGGAGAVKAERSELIAAGAKSITSKGAPIACDLIRVAQDITNLKAQSKKLNKIGYLGTIGLSGAAPLMQVLAPNIKTVFGTSGVSGIFVAGFEGADGAPNYSGAISSIETRADSPTGEAHVSATSKAIKFKPRQGDFVVLTEAPAAE